MGEGKAAWDVPPLRPSLPVHSVNNGLLQCNSSRLCGLSGRCRDLSDAVASFAVPAIDADRYRSVDRYAAHDAWLVAVIVDRLVLRGAIVPDHHIARGPAPAHRVFQPRHVILQHGKQMA